MTENSTGGVNGRSQPIISLYVHTFCQERDATMSIKPEHQSDPFLIETPRLPSVERMQQALATATSIDDFFGKAGIFARLFAGTLEQMLEAELTAHLGDEPYAG